MMATLDRRHWLRGNLAALAMGTATAASTARPKPVTLSLGFSLYGMKSLPMAEALRTCAQIGYDGVELALMPGWPTEPSQMDVAARRELRKRLADQGLAVLGLMENLAEPATDVVHRANLDRLKAAAELGHVLSPDVPPVIETILGGRPMQWPGILDRLVERLRAWAEVAAAANVVVAVKPHVANALHTPAAAIELLRRVESPRLRLAFDQSHFALRSLPLETTLADLLPWTSFIHVKDARGGPERFEFLLPGEGKIDYSAYFCLVAKSTYRGPVVVEVSGQISGRPGYDPAAAARRCYAALGPALQATGLRGK
jgi:inosose dehydratase